MILTITILGICYSSIAYHACDCIPGISNVKHPDSKSDVKILFFLLFSGIIGERIDAAVISVSEIIKEVPVINQMSMTNPVQEVDNPLFYGILPGDEGDAQVREEQ